MKLFRHKISSTSALLVFLSFWITVLCVRGVIFFMVKRGVIPGIFIYGYHIHHFVTGFIILILAFFLSSKKIWSKYIPLVLLGSGMALVCDELLFWTRGHFSYWSLINFSGVAIIGLVLASIYQYSRQTKNQDLPLRTEVKQWSLVLLPVLLAILLMLNWFSYFNEDAQDVTNKIFPVSFRHVQQVPELTPQASAATK